MPYYGDGLPYYYGGAFSNHSSLMTGTTRIHTPLSRYSPHLSTITESPLSNVRRYSPVTMPTRPKRVIDTADIDVSTPRILSHDGNRPKNRLRRDRPTIKIRSQALKDNPALREHYQKHEKTVGELLVEKFLIKDKKVEDNENHLRLFHQVSLDRDNDRDKECDKERDKERDNDRDNERDNERENDGRKTVQSKITRRFTRRRSSADIQLDPEQLEREVAYAQVQAEVLDSLVAEEQAEIENEVRRGTLIRKGTIGGPRTVPSFFRSNLDHDSMSQEEENEAAGIKMKKTLKKVKKKKKPTEKPSPPDDESKVSDSRKSSTSSDVSIGFRNEDTNVSPDDESGSKQMYKIEASNSAGDFSTIWMNTSGKSDSKISIEQFRESVKIPVPKKFLQAEQKAPTTNISEETETHVVLPVKTPYIKDTSRNSVYFTVKTTQENTKLNDETALNKQLNKLQKSESMANGIDERPRKMSPEVASGEVSLKKTKVAGLVNKETDSQVKENNLRKNVRKEGKDTDSSIVMELGKTKLQSSSGQETNSTSKELNDGVLDESDSPIIKNDVITKIKKDVVSKVIDKDKNASRTKANLLTKIGSKDSSEDATEVAANQKSIKFDDEVTRERQSQIVSISTDRSEKSVCAVDRPSVGCLPKVSKINTDENNAVEAPELSLRETAYLAKPSKTLGDVDVGGALPGKTLNKPVTLAKTSSSRVGDRSNDIVSGKRTVGKEEDRSDNSDIIGCATGATKLATEQTALLKGPKNDRRKTNVEENQKTAAKTKTTKIEDAKSIEMTKDTGLEKSLKDEVKKTGGEEPKFSGRTAGSLVQTKIEVEKNRHVEERGIIVDVNKGKPLKAELGKISATEVEKATLKENKVPNSPKTEAQKVNGVESKFPWARKGLPKVNTDLKGNAVAPKSLDKSISLDSQKGTVNNILARKSLKQSSSVDETQMAKISTAKIAEPLKPANKNQQEKPKNAESVEQPLNEESGTLSKSTSTESIDFWSEIKAPDSPVPSKSKVPFNYGAPKTPQDSSALNKSSDVEKTMSNDLATGKSSVTPIKELNDKKKETDPKISDTPGTPEVEFSNNPVIEVKRKLTADEESSKPKTEEKKEVSSGNQTEKETSSSTIKREPRKKKKNLLISIVSNKDAYSTIKKTPLKREDSSTSTISANSTPDTSVPASEVSTPVSEISLPLINITAAPTLPRTDSQNLEDNNEDPITPTNELSETGLGRITKWSNQNDLSNAEEKDITPVPSGNVSVSSTPGVSPESSKKKRVVKKKKSSTTKKSPPKDKVEKESKESRKDSKAFDVPTLKLPDRKTSPKTSPRNTPTQRPLDLIKMFYTTPSALLTATPRDLSKVRRAKIKRRKHQSRTPSVSSDSTGSTTSTATTESTDGSGSTCTELDDDAEHKRMNSTRSNDSGFDGSPGISNCDMACHKKCEKLTGNLCGLNQKLVAEALQALKRAPSQSSDNQRNSDSSDHFPSGRITPPATNLPRFKKYAVTDFNFLKVLGKGSFGKVLLAELRGTECVYAVKCLKKDVVLEDDDVECTLIERKVLTLATRHPYLCHLFCTFQTNSHLFFVMEYLNGGDLMFHIQKSGRFSEVRARFYAAEIWSGLNFLHKKGIVYRDLKLDNVLLDFEGHIRIADFGMCKLQIFLDRTADTFCGTPDYMAPEIIKGLKYNQAVDWWSYGVLLYEMLTGQSPFSGCDEDELFWSICNERPFIPRYLSQESTDILVCLLEKDSGKRLPGHEIALHPFFQSLPWDRLERRQLEAPFKPALDHTLDTRYFDTAFTAERPRLTPVPDQILTSMDQGVFRGFSYTNPNATD